MDPSISVIVVNLNGRGLLADCLDALESQDYPENRVEIVLVDNGSTDDSVDFVHHTYPRVRVVEAGHNLGFAGGNNLGARHATGDYLALINNDAQAEPGWLRAMVNAIGGQPDVVCAASKMLDQDGETIDFVGSVLNLYGRAFQIDKGIPVAPGFYDTPRELLAPCGGAMMIQRDVFWQIGGFDEDYVAYFEDVDLGWRLWLYGFKVLFVPSSVAYHRQHQTGQGFPVEQRNFLSEVNALRTVIKNYEDENLWRVLPLSLFLGVKRSLQAARVDRRPYHLGYPLPGGSAAPTAGLEPRMTRVATSFLVAIDQVADEMPRLMQKRRRIQAGRVRSDAEIFARFPMQPDNWLFPWRKYHVVQDKLVEEFELPEALRPRRGSRLLVVTHETIGPRMAGPGIRAWEMACALSKQFDVTLAAPGEPARSHPDLRVVGYEPDDPSYVDLAPYIHSADVVLAMGSLFVKISRLQDLNKPAIVDLYDPFELEKLTRSPTVEERNHLRIDIESMVHLRLKGAFGDFFICASERQRDFWLGVLLATGRLNTVTYSQDPMLRSLIDVVPFGVPAEPPRKQRAVLKGALPGIESDDKVLLWNGGLWQWFDPLMLLDAFVQVLQVREDVKLFFAAGRHFDPTKVPEMPIYQQTVARCRELDLLEQQVFFGDWIPYDERGDYLLEADLAVSIHQPTVESRFASRTRILDCIWAGLPVVVTSGDPLSNLVAQHNLGSVVPPADADALAQAILHLLADDTLRDRVARSSEQLCQQLRWARVVEPIAAFMGRAAFAPDALEAARAAAETRQLAAYTRRLETRVRALNAHIEEIRQGRVMRFMAALNSFLGRES